MKARIGFVSNSSSSSFCLVMTKKLYDGVYEQLNELEKIAATMLVNVKENFVTLMGYSSEDSNHVDRIMDFPGDEVKSVIEKFGESECKDILYGIDWVLRKKAKELDPKDENFIYDSMDW